MNININNKNCNLVKDYNAFLKRNCLTQIIHAPTRISSNCNSLIDHILVSNDINVVKSGVIEVGFSDHCLIYCTRKIQRQSISKENIIYVRSLKNYSKDSLTEAIRERDWSSVFQCNCTDKAWNNFAQIFNDIIDKIAPRRQRKIKIRNEPWMSHEIFECIQNRNKALKKFNRTKGEAIFTHRLLSIS